MKLYELQFSVRNGELVFKFTELFNAKNLEDAGRKAHLWCCDFYGDRGEKINDNAYEFKCGCIILTIDSVREVKKEEWKEEQFKFAFKEIK